MDDPTRIPYAQLRRFITVAMARLGLPAADAEVVGELMTQAELQGSDGHGVIRLLPCAFKQRVDNLVRELRAGKRMPEVERIWLPGEQSHERRAANQRDGIAIPAGLLGQLRDFARDMGIPALQAS